jgi:hypothetical protein
VAQTPRMLSMSVPHWWSPGLKTSSSTSPGFPQNNVGRCRAIQAYLTRADVWGGENLFDACRRTKDSKARRDPASPPGSLD